MQRKAVLLAIVLLVVSAGGVAAQPLNIPRFDFSFSNPGARSLGFAGAFAALADDATAAYANPAGLVQLAEPEVSLETRAWNRSTQYFAGGRLQGETTGRGIDTRQGLVLGRDDSSDFGASFASVVVPKGRWSLALYAHQLAKFEVRSESQGFFLTEDGAFPQDPSDTVRFGASRESVDLEVRTAGLAAAFRGSDQWSFGLALVYSDVALATRSDAYAPDDDSEESLFGEISFLPGRRLATGTESVDGTDLTVHAGLLLRPTEQLSAGLFYRQGAEVRGVADFESGPALPPFFEPTHHEAVFRVPDVVGAGLAWRSKGGGVTLAAEVDHVGYSDLIRIIDTETQEVEGRDYLDAWEYHLGAEYALLHTTPIVAFRAGTWIEANGDDLAGREFTHYSAGLGLVAGAFQVDLAGDFSEERDTASLSLIYTF